MLYTSLKRAAVLGPFTDRAVTDPFLRRVCTSCMHEVSPLCLVVCLVVFVVCLVGWRCLRVVLYSCLELRVISAEPKKDILIDTMTYKTKVKERAKRVGQCVLSASKWVTPLEFERLGGKSAKKWKSSLSHNGRPLSDYNLVCSTAETPSASITSDVAMQAGSTMIIDVVLAFIKVFRLRGDI